MPPSVTCLTGGVILDLKERSAFAKQIFPSINESDIQMSKGLSLKTQQIQRSKKIINAVLNDMIYGSIFWNFLERSLEFYCNTTHNNIEARKTILPHLARELIHFDKFAAEDLKNGPEIDYYNEEFFVNRTIFEECAVLANYYEIEIEHITQAINSQTKQSVNLTELREQNAPLEIVTEPRKASDKLPFFMEQLINYRTYQSSTSAQECLLTDLSNAKMKAFQAYILPVSGPAFVRELSQNSIIENKEPSKKEPVKATPKNKTSGSAKKKKKTTHKKLDQQDVSSLEPTKPVQEVQDQVSMTDVETNKAADIPLILEEDKSKSTENKLILKRIIAPQETKPVISDRAPIVLKRINLRDIKFHVEQRDSTSYSYKGVVYSLPFFQKSLQHFDIGFLEQIKKMTHLSPKTDKLPNLAQGFITFHFQVGKEDRCEIINVKDLFLSGGKFFGEADISFKKDNRIINAMQDMLTENEKGAIYSQPLNKRGIPLGIAMEKKLRSQIIGGPWRSNCLDSEALFLLRVTKSLPQILKTLTSDSQDQPVKINGVVLGISSYRDCCPNCQNLIQGFQWTLPNTILSSNIPGLTLDDKFASLAITFGKIRPENTKYKHPILEFLKGQTNLEPGKHKLICTYVP